MMNVMVKHMVEIAGGLVLGSLAGDAVNKVGKVAAKQIKKVKNLKKKG